MKRVVLAAGAAMIAMSVTAAWSDPIADRKQLMKDQGAAVGQIAPVVLG